MPKEDKKWSRPESVKVPTIWRRFEGLKPFPNGKIPKFRIQDVPEEMRNDVVGHMSTFFMKDEPLCENLKLSEDAEAIEDLKSYWHKSLQDKLALVTILENKDELEDESLPIIAGVNVTALCTQNDNQEPKLKSEGSKKILSLLHKCQEAVDCFKHYGVSEYLYALGLSVHPKFRGQGIGLELLKARFDLGRAVGLKLTVTVFTSIISQKLADRAGFETLYEIDYDDYKENGEVVFKGMKMKSCKLMAARIE